ncbi:MAG: hypothetical protein Q8M88_10960 [Phenylobacterium sp.]|uniref:hypothetical protein n=1 Tax=Phenylobacterium sp. TaxID=1871053 RepID=UPI002734A511|nr:hypothetical protein [Phenylobacterium sp.]MDP3174940.1 hypothetical protein [Phenylobacterium sp.]
MATYRLFMLDPEGHVRSATVLECADDAEATARAAEHPHEHGMELWQGARVVHRFERPVA